MAQGSGRMIQCQWNNDTIYQFTVDKQLVTSGDPNQKTRLKDVYIGAFRGESRPAGVEQWVQYCLKIINTDPESLALRKGLVIPSTREQYDLWPFRGEHFRRYVAWNEETGTVLKDLETTPHCTPLRSCCVVEPVYQELGSSAAGAGRYNAVIFEQMTPWERLEYLRQIIEALLELQGEENKVAGRRILAHRDIKVDNALIDRDYTSFRVILVDMASILFDSEHDQLWESDEVAQVSMGAGPHQTCNGILCSPNNTPPEQVFRDWPQSEKVDVFALGGILAGLFGSCVDHGRYDNRNPIWKFHDVHGWPGESNSNRPNASCPAAGEQASRMTLSDFQRRYEKNLDRDRTDPDRGTGWMEQDLMDHGITFAWGAEPGSEYAIPDDLLHSVRMLFRRCTRIDPRKRPRLRELLSEITRLQAAIPVSRNYQNERLYLAKELVHLYDLAGTDSGNINYHIYTRQAASMSHRAIRCVTFNGAGGYRSQETVEYGKSFRNMAQLMSYVAELRPAKSSESINVTHALISLYRFYARHRYDARFDGEIRIFTKGSRMEHLWDDYGSISVVEVLNDLEDLLGMNIKVRVYCPEGCAMPKLPDERFRWQKTSSFSSRTDSLDSAETTAPEPGKHKFPEPRTQTQTQPRNSVRAEDIYVCGEEGLYFLYSNKKVYVSKRRR